MNVEAQTLRTNLRNTGRVVAFQSEVAKMKASRWLSENVTFVDPDGVEIDRALLRADQSENVDDAAVETEDAVEAPDPMEELDA